jgi:hypothetical protein
MATDFRLSILGAALIIAAAILFTFRWEAAPDGTFGVMRLDRWTGNVEICVIGRGEPPQFIGATGGAVPYNCTRSK